MEFIGSIQYKHMESKLSNKQMKNYLDLIDMSS